VTLESCSIITTDANEFTAEFHDRMPVIIDRADWPRWLSLDKSDPRELSALLVPCPSDWLDRVPVSSFVNNVMHESPQCIVATEPERPLF
jgi:putative SOS response-associated peptidase YedK